MTGTVLYLTWLRESAPGHLDSDLGAAVPADRLELAILGLTPERCPNHNAHQLELRHLVRALESLEAFRALPRWLSWRMVTFFGTLNTPERLRAAAIHLRTLMAMCDRIRSCAGSRRWAEVYLPYFGRREWLDRFLHFATMNFTESRGAISATRADDPASLRDIAMRTGASVFQPRGDRQIVPYRFRFEGRIDRPWAALLASRWNLSLRGDSSTAAAVEILLQADGLQVADAWLRAPRPHHGRHHQVWARVALSVQWILRRWNLALQLSTPGGLADEEGCHHAMLYQAMRPWAENSRAEFCHDVLNEAFLREQFLLASKRLESLLIQGPACLRNPHVDPGLQAAKICDRAFRGRAVRTMLAAEEYIVNALLTYSNATRAVEAPRDLRKLVGQLCESFEEYLPRIFREQYTPSLGSAVFLEASSALYSALGAEPPLAVRIRFADGSIRDNRGQSIEQLAA